MALWGDILVVKSAGKAFRAEFLMCEMAPKAFQREFLTGETQWLAALGDIPARGRGDARAERVC